MPNKIIPNSYNGWDPLKQVILGNSYTPEFFDDVKDHKLRHLLKKLLYETQEDLNNFKSELENAGVEVLQVPANSGLTNINQQHNSVSELWENYNNQWNSWLASRGGMPKPWIAPRDRLITLGDKLTVAGPDWQQIKFLLDNNWIDREYLDTSLHTSFVNNRNNYGVTGPLPPSRYKIEDMGFDWEKANTAGTYEHDFYIGSSWGFQAPSVTRIGDTLVVDELETPNLGEYLKKEYPQFKQTHVAFGGHNDGIFSPVKPGHIITSGEVTDYSDTFPGWDVYVVDTPYNAPKINDWIDTKRKVNGKWWTPDAKNNSEYVNFVNTWLNEWVGEVEETIFEVNMLIINPELVFCTNYNEGVFKYLENIGITPHIVPFRHRFFWDSGLHCLTLDTIREGEMQSYF